MKGTLRRLECMAPVESIHGLLDNKSSKGFDPARYGMNSGRVVGFTKSWGTRNFFAVKVKPYSVSAAKQGQVLAHRAKFKAVAQAARNRMKNAESRQLDEAAWKAQTKYATFFGFLFADEWVSYED